MKTLYLAIIIFALLLFNVESLKQVSYAENKNYPVIITQVELDDAYKTIPPGFSCTKWNEMAGKGLVSYYCTENVIPKEAVECGHPLMNPNICNPVHVTYNFTDDCSFYSGFRPDGTPITTRYASGNQWILLQNTETIPINISDFNMKWNSTGFYENYETDLSLILYPHEQCRVASRFLETTEGTAMIQYQYQGNNYTFKTAQLADYYHDSRVWKYDGTNWTFKDEPVMIDAKSQTGLSLIPSHIPSPLKQFKSGTDASKVVCKQGFQLILKREDGSPACTKPSTAQKLIGRGWAKEMIQTPIQVAPPQLKGNETTIQATKAIPSCVSHIPHQYAIAGPPGGALLCPIMNFEASGKILNTAGFYGIYNYTAYPSTLNFVLESGHNGTISYLISINAIHNFGSVLEYSNEINITNNVTFMHDAGMDNHPGVVVSAEPGSEMIGNNESEIVRITFSAFKSALPGDYWVTLPPGFCAGGQIIILTITDCTK